MKKFKIITCVSQNLVIGDKNKLLYSIPNDMQNFRRITEGCVVVMGRNTFESIGKPLPNRINVILTNDEEYCVEENPDVYIVHSVAEAVELCRTLFSKKRWFVIGGQTVYNEFIRHGLVDEMYVTTVMEDKEGDAFFPDVFKDWKVFYESGLQTCDKTGLTYKFTVYTQKT